MTNTKQPIKKVLLGLMPFWDPLIPPSGIATLKGYLKTHDYDVKTVDAVVVKEFQDLYEDYFSALEEYVPITQRGNFYNMGHNVLQDHMMAHIHASDDGDYMEMVRLLVESQFSLSLSQERRRRLIDIITRLYTCLEVYLLELLDREKPDVFGLSAYKGTLPATMFAFRLCKKHFPHILTVMGGSVFSTTLEPDSPNYHMILEKTEPYIDKIIIGEGEILFLELLKGRLPENQRVVSIKSMGMEQLDLAEAPLPDYSDFDVALYPYMAATGATSCPYKCSFCNAAAYWGPYRKKDSRQVVREMTDLYKRYGNQLFYMSDSMINPIVTDLAKSFSDGGTSLYYDCFHRVDNATCDVNNTLKWRAGGLYRVRLGVESGSQKVLDLIGKKITVDQIRGALSALAYAGIKTTTYWVIGHPGETEADFQETLDLLRELKNDIYQAEPTPMEYNFSGQSNSDDWAQKRKMIYPEKLSRELLASFTWGLDCDPQPDVILERMYRFDNQRRELGIPNPYSLKEHFEADSRWRKLHKNAVPELLRFYNRKEYITENKEVTVAYAAENQRQDDGDFDF